jgi:hypothetical protein
MAFAMTVMSWGVIDYERAFVNAAELGNVKKAIKWGTDFFIKVIKNFTNLGINKMKSLKIFQIIFETN